MFRFGVLVSVFVLCFSALGSFRAIAEGPYILRAPISSYAPWRIVTPDGSFDGIDVELMRELCGRMGLQLTMLKAPFNRALAMLEEGTMDMGSSLQRRPEREKVYHYIEPPYITGSDKVFYVLREEGAVVARYADLEGLRIGVIPGTKYFPEFDRDEALTKVPCRDYEQLYSMLTERRLDAFVYTSSVGDYLMKKAGHEDTLMHAPYKYTKKLQGYLVISKKSLHARRLPEFSRHLKDMIDEGVVERIMRKYLSH